MKKYLSWWEENSKTKEGQKRFEGWCGSFLTPFKVGIRGYIATMGYRSILDCGAGTCSEYFGFQHDKYKIQYSAIDVTPFFVNEGKEKGIDIRLSDIDNIPFSDNSVDVCICLDVLNHQKDFGSSIDEMLRIAKKEVIITFFKDFSEKHIVKERFFDENKNCTLVYSHFCEQDIKNYLKEKQILFHFENIWERIILFIQK